jgi:O-antigen ligase
MSLSRIAVAGVPLVLVLALGAVQGGFGPDTWVWAGALAGWAAALGLTLTDRAGGLRRTWLWPASGGALLLWTLASSRWSAVPAQSVLETRRMIVYAAAVLALVVLIRAGSPWVIAVATHLAVTLLVGYALLRYLLGHRVEEEFEGHLISQPLGYANAVGILAVLGMLLALAPAVEGRPPAHRALAAASVPPLALALTFSGSDASWLSLAIGLATVAVLAPGVGRVTRMAALLAVPSAPLVWLAHESRLTHEGAPRIGGVAVLAAVVAAAIVAAALSAMAGGGPAGGSVRPRVVAIAAAAIIALGTVAVFAAAATTQPRTSYFQVAWDEYRAHPVLGSGAGTFGHYWLEAPYYLHYGGALDAHSLYLETLAELGPLGLLLLLVFLLYPLRGAVTSRAVRGVPAAAGAAVAFIAHASVDWDWELPAVVVAGLACLAAVCAARTTDDDEPVPRLARLAAVAAAVALGLGAIAGTASHAEPSAAETVEAP